MISLRLGGKAQHRTFDCSLVEFADDVAYAIHDIEDIVARRLATKDEWDTALRSAFDSVGGHLITEEGPIDAAVVVSGLFSDSWQRKRLIGRLVNIFMAAAKIVPTKNSIEDTSSSSQEQRRLPGSASEASLNRLG